MNKQVVISEKAPQAIGPYSAGIIAGNMVYTAGQLGIDRQTGEIVSGGIQEQTRMVLTNLKYILEEAGTSLDHVVKTTVFLKDVNEFGLMNEIYATFFVSNPPARSAVQVARLPKDAAVMIEAVALLP
jgi:2-iminobutanoate/2-iminopropanoate deaminase